MTTIPAWFDPERYRQRVEHYDDAAWYEALAIRRDVAFLIGYLPEDEDRRQATVDQGDDPGIVEGFIDRLEQGCEPPVARPRAPEPPPPETAVAPLTLADLFQLDQATRDDSDIEAARSAWLDDRADPLVHRGLHDLPGQDPLIDPVIVRLRVDVHMPRERIIEDFTRWLDEYRAHFNIADPPRRGRRREPIRDAKLLALLDLDLWCRIRGETLSNARMETALAEPGDPDGYDVGDSIRKTWRPRAQRLITDRTIDELRHRSGKS